LDYKVHRETCKGQIKPCPYCDKKFALKDFDTHCKKCNVCPYCEMNIIQDDLRNHIEKCGGRTEPCPACGKDITLKVGMDNHLNICMGDTKKNTKHEYNKFNINLDLLRMLIFQLIINLNKTIHLKKIRI